VPKITDIKDFKLQKRNKAVLVGLDERNREDREIEYFLESVIKMYYDIGKPTPIPDVIITAQMLLEGSLDDYLLEQCRYRDLLVDSE